MADTLLDELEGEFSDKVPDDQDIPRILLAIALELREIKRNLPA